MAAAGKPNRQWLTTVIPARCWIQPMLTPNEQVMWSMKTRGVDISLISEAAGKLPGSRQS